MVDDSFTGLHSGSGNLLTIAQIIHDLLCNHVQHRLGIGFGFRLLRLAGLICESHHADLIITRRGVTLQVVIKGPPSIRTIEANNPGRYIGKGDHAFHFTVIQPIPDFSSYFSFDVCIEPLMTFVTFIIGPHLVLLGNFLLHLLENGAEEFIKPYLGFIREGIIEVTGELNHHFKLVFPVLPAGNSTDFTSITRSLTEVQ